MTSRNKDPPLKEVPDVIINNQSRRKYAKGKFLGKGGFARCYELTDCETSEVFAGKVVAKVLLTKHNQKEKMCQEIAIHRSLNHFNVVQFFSYFEDEDNVYIVLEICKFRSLMEMHKRRRAISEPEARYLMQQIVMGVKYLHENKVIHRDLKLANILLAEDMRIKLGDFGLAAKVESEGERKMTLCGTPNYIAPEVLNKRGHSFEVDAWAVGCILYTFLVGKPPFETSSLKETYNRIKKNEYHIPSRVSEPAKNLIQRLLHPEPSRRPTMKAVLEDQFFTSGYFPRKLPPTCLTVAPRFDVHSEMSIITVTTGRTPLTERNAMPNILSVQPGMKEPIKSPRTNRPFGGPVRIDPIQMKPAEPGSEDMTSQFLDDLLHQLTDMLHTRMPEQPNQDEAEDPNSMPMLWISKWVDYSDKYGLGYELCDNSIGVMFNDHTRLVLLSNGQSIQYVQRTGKEEYYTTNTHPSDLKKKMTLLNYFLSYMDDHLIKAGGVVPPKDGDDLARLPYMRTWFRTKNAIVMFLTNGTLQLNFFTDHTKVVICPVMEAVTYIDSNKSFKTYKLKDLGKYGCKKDLYTRLHYARGMVERLKVSNSTTGVKGGTISVPSNFVDKDGFAMPVIKSDKK